MTVTDTAGANVELFGYLIGTAVPSPVGGALLFATREAAWRVAGHRGPLVHVVVRFRGFWWPRDWADFETRGFEVPARASVEVRRVVFFSPARVAA